jgi:capsid protein
MDKSRVGTQTVLELIEAQRLRTPAESKNKERDEVRNGVKYDSKGHVLGYYVKKYDKIDRYGDTLANFDLYPHTRTAGDVTRTVTRLFKAPLNSRPTGSRQYPVVTPIISLLKQMEDYLEAIIIGARVAACFAAFVTSNNPAGAFNAFTTNDDGTVTDPQDSYSDRRVHKLFPGMVAYLKPNENISFASPNRPNDNVDAFLVRLSKIAAMYLRIPYEILFLDLTESNYSSWKGASNELKKLTNRWRRQLEVIVTWYVRTVLLENIAKGNIRGDLSQIKIKVRWPSHGLLDPEKEARAHNLELKNGTNSPQRICEEEGISYEEVQQELLEDEIRAIERRAEVLKRQKELEEEYGIQFQIEGKTEERETDKRPGEGDVLDDEEKKERRKEDGNW